jgi:hypothetical protein
MRLHQVFLPFFSFWYLLTAGAEHVPLGRRDDEVRVVPGELLVHERAVAVQVEREKADFVKKTVSHLKLSNQFLT